MSVNTGLHNKIRFILFTTNSFRLFEGTDQYFVDTVFTELTQTRKIQQKQQNYRDDVRKMLVVPSGSSKMNIWHRNDSNTPYLSWYEVGRSLW